MIPSAAEVYLVDDDPAARDAVAALVRSLGLAVREYVSAEEFLQEFQGHRPACVVADLRLRGMSGLELLRELRGRGLNLPVVILTAHADTPTTVQAMKAGAFTTLDKPCRESELWETIRTALEDDVGRSEEDRRRGEIRARLDSLTMPQREVLRHLLAGEGNKQIAHHVNIGMRTIEGRKQAVLRKMMVASIAELVQLVMFAAPDWMPTQPGLRPPNAEE